MGGIETRREANLLKDYIKMLRPTHWIKNIFLFAGIVFGQKLLSTESLIPVVQGFICFCGVSSAIYIFNDLWDLQADRQHPVKRNRPLAAGIIKIPSAINTNQKVLDYLFREYDGEIHISFGMTNRQEETAILDQAKRHGRVGDLVLYHCISGYPVNDEDLYLNEIKRLKKHYGDQVKGIGFSGHHRGIAADIAALALGAQYFERHFTLDRTWKGTDHAASLEPDGFRRLVRDLRDTSTALRSKSDEILDFEWVQRKKLKRFVPVDA